MHLQDIVKEIQTALTRQKISAAAASKKATGNPSLIKNIQAGHVPRADSLLKLANVLGLKIIFMPGDTAAMVPVTDSRLAELFACLTEAWEQADEFERGKLAQRLDGIIDGEAGGGGGGGGTGTSTTSPQLWYSREPS